MDNARDFVIENGVLTKYQGTEEYVVIPAGVTAVGVKAFGWCKSLNSVTIPESVTAIGDFAFCCCSNLHSISIPSSVTSIGKGAFSDCDSLTDITIPEGVTSIGRSTFSHCGSLSSVTIPERVTAIGDYAFYWCENLTSITLPDSLQTIGERVFEGCYMLSKIAGLHEGFSFGEKPFGDTLPEKLHPYIASLVPAFTYTSLKKYVLDSGLWKHLPPELQADIFITRQSKSLLRMYADLVRKPDVLGNQILQRISNTYSREDCDAVATFFTIFAEKASKEILQQLYEALLPLKTASHALKTIRANVSLMNKLGIQASPSKKLSKLDTMVLEILQTEGKTEFDVTNAAKEFYGAGGMPIVACADGSKGSALAMAYLLTAHEKLQMPEHGKQPIVVAAYKKPGICEHATRILALLDPRAFQTALQDMADGCLGIKGHSKCMFTAYPICRYADETLMAELVKRAPKWASTVSGNDAPALYTFRQASLYSNTRAAMLCADKFGDLEVYSKIRGTDADTIRDKYLSDIGLDAHGGKVYDLGNQSVTVRLQEDLSFLVELPSGKTAKSLPKKGADAGKYAVANADFSEIKKAAKKIVKNRSATLFADFLSGRTRKADDWQKVYLNNPLLRQMASLFVWTQDGSTFLLTRAGTIRPDGIPYTIGSGKIALAHPMEMTKADLTAWQKYFNAHQIKQPFEQIWEPAIDLRSIAKERYKGCMIPYYRFINQEKHGIHVEDWNYHDEITITFDDCDADVLRIDWLRHDIQMDHRFEIQRFSVKKATRRANHIVAYLDRITIQNRILDDDTGIAPLLPRYTLAQITEFLEAAMENNCTNVTALLLEYRNQHFADFDPMEEFSLEM